MPTDKDRGSTTPASVEPTTQPCVTTTKRVTFSRLMLIEALNTVYGDLNIRPDAKLSRDGDCGTYTAFEWDEP
jgi:hypothetical protein